MDTNTRIWIGDGAGTSPTLREETLDIVTIDSSTAEDESLDEGIKRLCLINIYPSIVVNNFRAAIE